MFRWSRLERQLALFVLFAVATAPLLVSTAGMALCPSDKAKTETGDPNKAGVVSQPPDQGKTREALDSLQRRFQISSWAQSLRKTSQGSGSDGDSKRTLENIFRRESQSRGFALTPAQNQPSTSATGALFLRSGGDADVSYGSNSPSGRARFSEVEVPSFNTEEDLQSEVREKDKTNKPKEADVESGNNESKSSKESQRKTSKAIPTGLPENVTPDQHASAASQMRHESTAPRPAELKPLTHPPTVNHSSSVVRREMHPANEVLELNTSEGISTLSGTGARPIGITKKNLGRAPAVIVRGDEPPPAVKALLDTDKVVWVRSSARSPNQDSRSIARTAERLTQPLDTGNLKIFNGLPDADVSFASLDKMSLPKEQFVQWRKLGKNVQKTLDELQFNSQAATKSAMLKELSEGTSEVVILVAHNDNGTLRFQPQTQTGKILGIDEANEETLSLSDLESASRRTTVPHRTVILVSCKAGTVNAHVASFGETLLSKGFADAVIASSEDVPPGDFPNILNGIRAKTPPIQLFHKYHFTQIVFHTPRIKKYADG